MDILLASSNDHKRKELEILLKPHKLHLPSEFALSFDCEENAPTFEGNALIKAQALRKQAKDIDMPVLADDSGLIVNALPGLLGVKTARFGSPDGITILPAAEKNKLLLEMLKDKKDRTACFYCAVAMIFPNGRVITALGKAPGSILTEPTGNGGFGYDPVFFNNEANMPSGLLTVEGKNKYGHRGKATRALLKELEAFA